MYPSATSFVSTKFSDEKLKLFFIGNKLLHNYINGRYIAAIELIEKLIKSEARIANKKKLDSSDSIVAKLIILNCT